MQPTSVTDTIRLFILSFQRDEFQKFGDRLLTILYKEEYHATRAAGAKGDFTNDGYCPTNRTFFHFYGPERSNSKNLKKKMSFDISNCLKKQKDVKKIVYLTNDTFLGEIEAHIDEMRRFFNLDIETWSIETLICKIKRLEKSDIEYILDKQLYTNEKNWLTYKAHEGTMKEHSIKKVMNRSILFTVALLSTIAIHFSSITSSSYIIYISIYFIIVFSIILTQFKYFTMFMALKSNKEISIKTLVNVKFYKKENGKYLEYNKTAKCLVPGCQGKVITGLPPQREKSRFSIIGYCSEEKTLHTYTVSKNNSKGHPVELNFEPVNQK